MKNKMILVVILITLVILIIFMRFFIKEENKNKDIMENSKDISGKLTIYEDVAFDSYEYIAKMFCEIHPNVDIVIKNEYEESKALNEEIFSDKVRSSNEIDLIDLTGMDYYNMLEEGGLLEPLNQYYMFDDSFVMNDYFNSMYEACTLDGNVFAFPRAVEPIYVKLNKDYCDLISSNDYVNIDDLQGAVEKCEDELAKKRANMQIAELDYVFDSAVSKYKNSEEINKLKIEELMDNKTSEYYPAMTINVMDKRTLLRRLEVYPMQNLDDLLVEAENVSKAIQYIGVNGENYMDCYGLLAISRQSKNKDLAWEFMKFVISNQSFMEYDNIMVSVNKDKATRLYSGISDNSREAVFNAVDNLNFYGIYNYQMK